MGSLFLRIFHHGHPHTCSKKKPALVRSSMTIALGLGAVLSGCVCPLRLMVSNLIGTCEAIIQMAPIHGK